jgi:excisionase family DNA binding protein
MDTNHPLTLTVEQTAKVLGIGRSTAYELVHTGDIPSLRLGRRIVVPVGKIAEQLGLAAHQVRALVEPESRVRDGRS